MDIKFGKYIIQIDAEDLPLFQSCRFNIWKRKQNIKLRCVKNNLFFEALIFKKYNINEKMALFLDKNCLNFKKENLRVFKTIKRNKYSIPYLGVHFDPRIKVYTCYLSREYNGTYYTAEEAALAYNELAIKRYGQFALLNDVSLINKTEARDVRLKKQVVNLETYSEVFCKQKNGTFSFLLDNDKLWILEKYSCHVRNSNTGQKYAVIYNTDTKKKQYLHNFLTNCPKHLQVDHINRNSLDNRLENLRVVTALVNIHNTVKKPGRSGYSGIAAIPRKNGLKYKPRFKYKGVVYDFGVYDSLEEAITVYEKKSLEIKKDL